MLSDGQLTVDPTFLISLCPLFLSSAGEQPAQNGTLATDAVVERIS